MSSPIEESADRPEVRHVGLAELTVVRDQNVLLCSHPLGAGLAVAIHDPGLKIGALLVSLLPDSSLDRARAAQNPALFLDTGFSALIGGVRALGARPENLLVYAAGAGKIMDDSAYFDLGGRNYARMRELLESHGLKIKAEDVAGLVNRTLQLNVRTGEARVKVSGQAQARLLCRP